MNKHKAKSSTVKPAPWYKHIWVWFIIVLPLTGVVASLYTVYVAHQHAPEVISQQNKFRLSNE